MNLITYTKDFEIIWIVLVMTAVRSIEGESMCLAKNDVKWNSANKICTDCKKCSIGKGRNFTSEMNLPRDEHGDLECLPCRRCPKGTFDVNFNNDCQMCDNPKCSRFNRNIYEECNSFSDVKCGSCKSGFVDEAKSLDMPCSPDEQFSKDGKPNPQLYAYKQLTTISSNDLQVLEHRSELAPVIAIAFGGTIVFIGSVLLLIIVYRRKRTARRKLEDIYSSAQVTEQLLDLEMDCPGQTTVRGELASVPRRQLPYPEFSNDASSMSGPRGMRYVHAENVSRLDKQVCHCDLSNTNICNTCNTYAEQFRDIKIEKGDTIVSIVSSNVCHDPVPLIHELNVPDPDHYQIDNDRQRNPEGVSQKEYIQRTLNRWLETVKEVELLRLSQALCARNFHHINVKIMQHLNDRRRKDDANDEDTNSIASMVS